MSLLPFVALVLAATTFTGADSTVLAPVNERFQSSRVREVPYFQKHVMPLVGRLGCSGRACHGSFQGRGGFRLSLFGYDFKSDHDAILDGRVDADSPAESLILSKPTDADAHEGGLRYEEGSWQYHLLRRWIDGGATFESEKQRVLSRLDVVPSEIVFHRSGEHVQLRAVAIWADGACEDVTPLCRFQTNSSVVAEVDEQGRVTSVDPGDSHLVVSYDKAVQPVPVLQPVSRQRGADYPDVATPTQIDRLVVQKSRKLGIVPSPLSTDEDFLRRVRIDMTGSLPSEDEVRKFLADTSPNKRSRKIDELLETPAYAALWTTKFCDLIGNNLREYLSVTMLGKGTSGPDSSVLSTLPCPSAHRGRLERTGYEVSRLARSSRCPIQVSGEFSLMVST